MESHERSKLSEGLHAIDQTATRLTAMINELLDVARLQMGRPLLLDRQQTDLVALAQQVATELQPSTDRHDLVVEAQTERTTGPWDRARLERVISNLVSNAIKFSPEGGRVTLVLRHEQRGTEPWAALDVRDEGIGIPPEDVPRIFERFYRGSNVQGAIEGTGLGLAGAAQIVQQHGGRLDVKSEQGQGSIFTMYLPFRVPQTDTEAPRQGRRRSEQAQPVTLRPPPRRHTMRAALFNGPRTITVGERPDPTIEKPSDAIVRVVLGCVCGSDLWYYRGESPHDLGAIGHEFIGVVEEVGAEVRGTARGDLVVAPFTFSDACMMRPSGIGIRAISSAPRAAL